MKKYIVIFSIVLNILISLPALVLLLGSSAIQYDIYQNILAPRFGKPEIVFIGDSITRGGNIWAFRIGRYNLNVWNYGHGGMTTSQIQHYAKEASVQVGVQYAFVMAGINDLDKTLVGAEKSFDEYKLIIETLSLAGITPVIQFTLYRESEPNPEFIDRLNEKLKAYAMTNNLLTIDLNPILAPQKSLLPKYSWDGVHLNDVAYDIWGKQIRLLLYEIDKKHIDGVADAEPIANASIDYD